MEGNLMTKYRLQKIRNQVATGKAYISGIRHAITYPNLFPCSERCFVVVCPDKTYLVPIASSPSLIIFAPQEEKVTV
jgi:hypothetical protein